jgi:hypothetical protein
MTVVFVTLIAIWGLFAANIVWQTVRRTRAWDHEPTKWFQ